jgi:dihydroxyacid dehydratase/phosphogluconate dehydratase
VPRLVSVLPNGPDYHPTARLPRGRRAGGDAPPARSGLLHLDAMTVTGQTVGENLDWWQASERRAFRQCLREQDGVDPDDVILPPERQKRKG